MVKNTWNKKYFKSIKIVNNNQFSQRMTLQNFLPIVFFLAISSDGNMQLLPLSTKKELNAV